MFGFGLRKILLTFCVFIIVFSIPIYISFFNVSNKNHLIILLSTVVMSILIIIDLTFRILKYVLQIVYEYKEYGITKNNNLLRNFMVALNFIFYLMIFILCFYNIMWQISLSLLYLNFISIIIYFSFVRYNIFLNKNQIIFMDKEEYIRLDLKNISDVEVCMPKGIKIFSDKKLLKIKTIDKDFSLYTANVNLEEIFKVLRENNNIDFYNYDK